MPFALIHMRKSWTRKVSGLLFFVLVPDEYDLVNSDYRRTEALWRKNKHVFQLSLGPYSLVIFHLLNHASYTWHSPLSLLLIPSHQPREISHINIISEPHSLSQSWLSESTSLSELLCVPSHCNIPLRRRPLKKTLGAMANFFCSMLLQPTSCTSSVTLWECSLLWVPHCHPTSITSST